MRMIGLNRKIALRLALLLVAAMVLIDLAVLSGAQKAMVRHRIADAKRLLHQWADQGRTASIDLVGGARPVSLTRYSGRRTAQAAVGKEPIHLDGAAWQRLDRGETVVRFQGSAWGVFWVQPRQVVVAIPLANQAPPVAAAAGLWPLEPVYRELRRLQPMMAAYMLVNLLLLELAGVYLLGRVTVRPLQRLVSRAETFSEGSDIFPTGAEDQDYGRLSRALNRIYGRMQSDREALGHTVERLEAANQRLKEAQQEVLRAEKLAAVGRLSAGLAHEIGNPLGIVTGYLELLRQPGMSDDQRRDMLVRTEEEIGRIGRILRQLLDLARPGQQTDAHFGMHALILETARIFEQQPLTADIALTTRLEAPVDRVQGDAERLRQVFLNLMINAADAIREAGDRRKGRLEIASRASDGTIEVCFTDNGGGIDEAHLPLIFDPFFSTKAPGQGTGLGLAVSFMIVEAMGGRLAAESVRGGGTTLRLTMPLADGQSE